MAMQDSDLQAEVNNYVEELFEQFTQQPQSSGKVIRDPIHGYHYLEPHEVEILDSPVVQRLRYIHQTALAYLVYPSANHTRLEHSLGVAKVVRDIGIAFNQGQQRDLFDSNTVEELRIAALLHDVGHGIFSHLSETLIDHYFYEQLQPLKRQPPFEGKPAGEILSYMIVTSPPMRRFLEEVFQRHNKNYSVVSIAGYLIGKTNNPDMEQYQADVITGPIDADKLDYIARDSYFTGIQSEVDVPHIIRSLVVWNSGGGVPRTLAVRLSGAHAIEQLHFAKLLLFPAVYHHQKVRALEATIRGIFETIWEAPDDISEQQLRFNKITDFLRMTEGEFLYLASKEPKLARKTERLLNRVLLKRALHISSSVIERPLHNTDYSDLVKLDMGNPRDYQYIKQLRQEIFDNIPTDAKSNTDISDFWLDLPKTPGITKDIIRCYVVTGEGNPVPLRTLFPIDAWLESYAENKWTGHVFFYPDTNSLRAANKASIDILQDQFRLKFTPRSSIECKLDHPR